MSLEDLLIRCVDCGNQFVWSIGEQLFFQDRGLKNPPKRCKPCKKIRTERIASAEANVRPPGERVSVEVTCAQCGEKTTVPFYPTQGRPVYCHTCFNARRVAAESTATTSIAPTEGFWLNTIQIKSKPLPLKDTRWRTPVGCWEYRATGLPRKNFTTPTNSVTAGGETLARLHLVA